ncbi:MAG: adenylate/guanylate cyclase domain-containing protein [Candidatus Binatia bacterium]
MRCASCGFENLEGLKFCEECGTKLIQICPSCGHEVRPTAKFCGECGVSLVPSAQSSTTSPQPPTPSPEPLSSRPQAPGARRDAAERRQLTVMFCDLVGSTALSEQLDPEEWREVVRVYQETCAEVIRRFDGHITQYLGDGLLIYFGYPAVYEDDAARAVRTGLEIIAALRHPLHARLEVPSPLVGEGQGEGAKNKAIHTSHPNLLSQGEKELRTLQVRIGVHTGLVVIGDIGAGERTEQLTLGDTPNIAARLQGLAAPNTVVISAATQRLIAGFFDCHDSGLQSLKGVSTPIRVYRVLSESSAQSRLEVEVSTGRLTPLVGRAHEMGLLLERWTAAQAGDGQVVLLNGEPGIGKSRLMQEVKERLIPQKAMSLEFRCSPYAQNSAFSPVLAHLQRVLQFERDEKPQGKLTKLQQTLTRYHFPQADTFSLLAALLSLPHPEGAPLMTTKGYAAPEMEQVYTRAWEPCQQVGETPEFFPILFGLVLRQREVEG